MPLFQQSDLTGNIQVYLSIIINYKLDKPIMTSYNKLLNCEKREFNLALNKYIKELDENWESLITHDFHEICTKMIFESDAYFMKSYIALENKTPELI